MTFPFSGLLGGTPYGPETNGGGLLAGYEAFPGYDPQEARRP